MWLIYTSRVIMGDGVITMRRLDPNTDMWVQNPETSLRGERST